MSIEELDAAVDSSRAQADKIVSLPTEGVTDRDATDQSTTGSEPAGASPKPARPRPPLLRTAREYAVLALIAILLASLVRAFLGQAYYIPSVSMVPTLKVNDRVIVSRLSYRLGDPKRGDIIVFQNPSFENRGRNDPLSKIANNVLELIGMNQPDDKYYIKRAIGVPGDRVTVKDGHVWINDKQLNEPWLQPQVVTDAVGEYGVKETKLGKDQYFMMGDNRPESSDSRFFGPINRSRMVGKAFVRIYPFGRFGGLGSHGS